MKHVVQLTPTASFVTGGLRVVEAFGYQGKSLGWRWALTVEVNGFKITKRSKRTFKTEQKALDNAEENGIEIHYEGI